MTENQSNGIHTADVASPILVTDAAFQNDTSVTKETSTAPKDTGVRLKTGKVSVTPVPSVETSRLKVSGSRSARESPLPRKQLPPIPDSETEAAMAATVNNNLQNAMMTGGGYGPFLLEYSLMAEYTQLHKQKLPGVYVIPSALTPLVWNGVLFIRQGMYQGGVFKFSLNIPENYPEGDCPKLVFDYPVFHPLVDPKTGELDVKRAFPKWRRNVHQMWQVLLYARKVFYKIDTKSPWDQEAAELYEQDIEAFKKRVSDTVQESKDSLQKPVESQDLHAIRFPDLDPTVREETKAEMLRLKRNHLDDSLHGHRKNGLSWIKKGSSQIFSRDDTPH